MGTGNNKRVGIRTGTNSQWQGIDTTPGAELGIWNKELIYVSGVIKWLNGYKKQ